MGEMPVLIISQNPITFLLSVLPSVCERIAVLEHITHNMCTYSTYRSIGLLYSSKYIQLCLQWFWELSLFGNQPVILRRQVHRGSL